MTEDLKSSFINEARELLFQLESDLLQLEKRPGDKEVTNTVFRVMHNLKGAARMYGFEEMQFVSHEFENIFDLIRSGNIKVTKELIDDTLHARDILLAMLENSSCSSEHQEFLDQMQRKYTGSYNIENTVQENEKVVESPQKTWFCIWFSPDKGVFERGLNPDKVIEEILATGGTKVIVHENGSSWEAQKLLKQCETIWEIYLNNSRFATNLEEIFLFYDPQEYCIVNLKEDYEKNQEMLEFFRKVYSNTLSLKDHIRDCLSEINAAGGHVDISEYMNEKTETVDAEQSFSYKTVSDNSINVSSQKLDELLNLVSELVISTAALDAQAARLKDLRLTNLIENIEKLTKKFRSNALDLRLIPVGTLMSKFHRQVRDLSVTLGKRVALMLDGQETEIDKTVLKSIESPLMHIIRNSIDHGIESPEERLQKGKSMDGLLKITSFYSGANVIIQVHDDGRGINLEKIRECAVLKGYITTDQSVTTQELLNMIMEPGFTTSDNVSIVSGRGVGMDVVKRELNAIGGSLVIETEKDLGTSITLKLPTTLSIIDTLLLEVNASQVLIPLLEVEYCFKESHKNIFGKNSRYLEYKNDMVPFISLREKFNYPALNSQTEEMVIIINKFDKKYALIVDDILGEQQAVIKPLGGLFSNQPYFSGGSIMVDGNLALVLDTNHLFN